MKQLIIFGDSVMKGVVYSAEQHRHHLMRGKRFPELEDAGIEVVNYSRFGATVTRGYRELQAKLDQTISDTAVMIGFGGNDCAYDWDAVSNDPSGSYSAIVPEEQFVADYKKCVYLAKSMGARVVIPTLVPIDPMEYMDLISTGRNRDNILKWLGDEIMLYRWHEHYNELVMRVADRTGAELLDLRTPFLTDHSFRELISPDGIHPTEKGYAKIERETAKFFLGNGCELESREALAL